MDIGAILQNWKARVNGQPLDIDRKYGKQCADVPLSFGLELFPDMPYSRVFPPISSAKDMFDTANLACFDKIVNNPADVNQLPRPGDVAVFAASPERGYTSTFQNPDGTVGVVDHADGGYVYLWHQDGNEPAPTTRLKKRAWRYTRCMGWLRPKSPTPVPEPAPAPQTVVRYVNGVPQVDPGVVGRTLYLKPYVEFWRVYDQNVAPKTGAHIYKISPKKYGGLSYRIESIFPDQPQTVRIRTQDKGIVNIYVDGDAEIK